MTELFVKVALKPNSPLLDPIPFPLSDLKSPGRRSDERVIQEGGRHAYEGNQGPRLEGMRPACQRFVSLVGVSLPQILTRRTCTEFAECATGRTVSVAWACKSKYKEVQECISRL